MKTLVIENDVIINNIKRETERQRNMALKNKKKSVNTIRLRTFYMESATQCDNRKTDSESQLCHQPIV